MSLEISFSGKWAKNTAKTQQKHSPSDRKKIYAPFVACDLGNTIPVPVLFSIPHPPIRVSYNGSLKGVKFGDKRGMVMWLRSVLEYYSSTVVGALI